MLKVTSQKPTDRGLVLVVDYHELREIAKRSVVDLHGVTLDTTAGVFTVTRVGAPFRASNTQRVYLYVTPATVADADVTATVAANCEARNDARREAAKQPPVRMGDHFTPTGWGN